MFGGSGWSLQSSSIYFLKLGAIITPCFEVLVNEKWNAGDLIDKSQVEKQKYEIL